MPAGAQIAPPSPVPQGRGFWGMRIKIDGLDFDDWRTSLPAWWELSHHAALQRLPTDGTAVLVDGPPMVVAELRRSGRITVNVVSDVSEPCGLPINGICFACP